MASTAGQETKNRTQDETKKIRTLSVYERKIKLKVARRILASFLKNNAAFKRGLNRNDLTKITEGLLTTMAGKDTNKATDMKKIMSKIKENINELKKTKERESKEAMEISEEEENSDDDEDMEENKDKEDENDDGSEGEEDDETETKGDDEETDEDNDMEEERQVNEKEKNDTVKSRGDQPKKGPTKSNHTKEKRSKGKKGNASKKGAKDEATGKTKESHIFKFSIRMDLISVTKAKRQKELREQYDKALDILRRENTDVMLLPLQNPTGKKVKYLASKKGKVTFNDDEEEELPKLAAYTNEWVTNPSDYIQTTTTFHVECSIGIYDLFIKSSRALLKSNMEMNPMRMNIEKTSSVPIGLVLPGYTSVDHRSLSLRTKQKYGVDIHFELVMMENNKFRRCKYNDPECIGYAVVVNGRDISEGVEICEKEWPFVGRREKYMEGTKMAVFPLDEKLELHPKAEEMAKKQNMEIIMCMHADYHHSRIKVEDGGGAIFLKFARGVDSCSTAIKTKGGIETTLRELITSFKDPVTKKPRIAGVCPMPAKEDAGGIYTNFTAMRTSSRAVTHEMAKRTEEFIRTELARAIWDALPKEEAEKVLAKEITGRLAMSVRTTLDTIGPIFASETPENEALEENSVQSQYVTRDDQSQVSGMTTSTAKTTGSTRAKLVETQMENEQLEEANAELAAENQRMRERHAKELEEMEEMRRLATKYAELMKNKGGIGVDETKEQAIEDEEEEEAEDEMGNYMERGGEDEVQHGDDDDEEEGTEDKGTAKEGGQSDEGGKDVVDMIDVQATKVTPQKTRPPSKGEGGGEKGRNLRSRRTRGSSEVTTTGIG